MTLADCPYMKEQRITALGNADLVCLGVRLGICPGAMVRVTQRLPGGTTVIALGRQEVVLGPRHAACVLVEDCGY